MENHYRDTFGIGKISVEFKQLRREAWKNEHSTYRFIQRTKKKDFEIYGFRNEKTEKVYRCMDCKPQKKPFQAYKCFL